MILLYLFIAVILTAAGIGLYIYISFKNFDPKSIGIPREKNPLHVTPALDVVEYNGKLYKYNDDIVNVLFIGLDNETSGITRPGQIPSKGGQADVLILLSIDVSNQKCTLFNIYRDCMTDIAIYDLGQNYVRNEVAQICLAHHYGDGGAFSARLTEQAAANLLGGIKIYRYIRLNVEGLVAATDLFGGVEITLPEDMVILGKGYAKDDRLTMDGRLTDSYLRQRDTGDLTSSIARSGRHMYFIKTLLPQMERRVKDDPFSVFSIYSKLGGYVSTDLTLPELNYVMRSLMAAGFGLSGIMNVPGEMAMGEIYAEFNVDKDELYDIIIDNYYYEIPENKK